MRKLRLDVELLDVQSFNAGGIRPADLRYDTGTCNSDCGCQCGTDGQKCGSLNAVQGYAWDGPRSRV